MGFSARGERCPPDQGTPDPECVRVRRAPTGVSVSVSACASRGRPGTGSEGGPFLRAGRRRPALQPPGPLFSCKAALCGGCGPPAPAACCGGRSRWGPRRSSPPSASPHTEGPCLLGTCARQGPVPPGGQTCPALHPWYPVAWRGWAWGQLSVPMGRRDSSVSPAGMGTVQCPHRGQLCVPPEHRDSSVSSSGTGTALCPHWARGQLNVPIGHGLCPLWAQRWLSVPRGWLSVPGGLGTVGVAMRHPGGRNGPHGPAAAPPPYRGDLGGAGGQAGTQGTLRATLGLWHGLACVPTPNADKDRV